MTRFSRIFLLALLLAASLPSLAVGLPDTGQDTCYNDTVADGVAASDPASIARDAGSHPRQDCRYGRDAKQAAGSLTKTGAGAKGFDYTKIANDGSTLAAGAALGSNSGDWSCTKDNITGLTWEVKTATNTDLRYSGHIYIWYNSDGASNGGNSAMPAGEACTGDGYCDTEAFVTAVNTAMLCSYTDWRMPTRRELLTLVHAGAQSPNIDPTYFPNTPASYFWSGSSYVPNPGFAWRVNFFTGLTGADDKMESNYVRLVRGGQF